ncbi:MAG: polyphosphate kinase 2 family protein [Planctomycetes bacterium]|nr:polyphosphate kinase 2 family protein [Planctomycetota bacterium]
MNLFRVRPGGKVDLGRLDSAATPGTGDKKEARRRTLANVKRLGELQYLLYAEGKRSLLVVLQGMDAGGKDGVIRHVMTGVNPQGCRVTSFKTPTPEELAHDFLWRIHKAAPRKGEIGVFNRSHYEDVLVVRVHNLVPKAVWSRRYRRINEFERLLADGGVHVVKFFLHVSKDEQFKRLRERLKNPARHWKVNPNDFEERRLWDDYMRAYEAALSRCSTEAAPWFVIPADHKWFRDLAVSEILVSAMERLDMKFPAPDCDIEAVKKKYL